MGGFKFVVTLKITFEKNVGEKKDIKTAYFNSLPEIVLNRCDINLDFPIENILNKINRWISEGSAWTIHFIDNHYVNIIKYNPLKGNLYITLPKELKNSAKGLINLKNKGDMCFLWCHIRHLQNNININVFGYEEKLYYCEW